VRCRSSLCLLLHALTLQSCRVHAYTGRILASRALLALPRWLWCLPCCVPVRWQHCFWCPLQSTLLAPQSSLQPLGLFQPDVASLSTASCTRTRLPIVTPLLSCLCALPPGFSAHGLLCGLRRLFALLLRRRDCFSPCRSASPTRCPPWPPPALCASSASPFCHVRCRHSTCSLSRARTAGSPCAPCPSARLSLADPFSCTTQRPPFRLYHLSCGRDVAHPGRSCYLSSPVVASRSFPSVCSRVVCVLPGAAPRASAARLCLLGSTRSKPLFRPAGFASLGVWLDALASSRMLVLSSSRLFRSQSFPPGLVFGPPDMASAAALVCRSVLSAACGRYSACVARSRVWCGAAFCVGLCVLRL